MPSIMIRFSNPRLRLLCLAIYYLAILVGVFLVAFLACLKAGHSYVPIDSGTPPQRVEKIVSTAAAALVLTPESIASQSDGTRAAPARAASPDEVHYIMFTSGSTGEPKGVPVT